MLVAMVLGAGFNAPVEHEYIHNLTTQKADLQAPRWNTVEHAHAHASQSNCQTHLEDTLKFFAGK